MTKSKKRFVCTSCGFSSVKWLGRCPECGQWDCMEERHDISFDASHNVTTNLITGDTGITSLADINGPSEEEVRFLTGIGELDRVLGGGIVPGSLILLGGEPGIGKSTLLLQVLAKLAAKGHRVLYASGEESSSQIRLRAKRLGIKEDIMLICQPQLEIISKHVQESNPDVLAVDSIQTMYCQDVSSLPGSIGQVKATASRLIHLAKGLTMPIFIVGHVTKDGIIAGPRALEHLMDTVLYFEGDRTQAFRLLRTVKNRFGPTHEIGIFEMKDSGLEEVKNPSDLFLEHRNVDVPGSAIFPCIEGTRPLLVEIQALVNQSYMALPRRTTAGFDSNRLALLTAVTEKLLGTALFDKDIFVNVAGGFKITEPAGDLPLICAILSSFYEKPLAHTTAIFGEVGLTGEVRPVSNMELRVKEAQRLGLKRCLMPMGASLKKNKKGIEVMQLSHISMLPEVLFGEFCKKEQ